MIDFQTIVYIRKDALMNRYKAYNAPQIFETTPFVAKGLLEEEISKKNFFVIECQVKNRLIETLEKENQLKRARISELESELGAWKTKFTNLQHDAGWS